MPSKKPDAHHSRKPAADDVIITRATLDYFDSYTNGNSLLATADQLPTHDELVGWKAKRDLFLHMRMLYERGNE